MKLAPRLPLRGRTLLLLLPVIAGVPLAVAVLAERHVLADAHRLAEATLPARLEARLSPLVARLEAIRGQLRLAAALSGDGVAWETVVAGVRASCPEIELLRRVDGTAAAQPAGTVPQLVEPLLGARPRCLVATLSPAALAAQVTAGPLAPVESIMTVLQGCRLTGADAASGLPRASAARLQEALVHGGEPVLVLSTGAEPLLAAVQRRPDLGLAAALLLPDSAVRADLAGLGHALWLRAAASALLALWMLLRVRAWLVRPLREISARMREVAQGNLELKLEAEGHDELARVAEAFNAMTANLHNARVTMESQRLRLAEALRDLEGLDRIKDSFLALVSHEVRTPLTSILAGIEFLMDGSYRERSADEQALMEIVHESGSRLAGFMNDALLMASLQASRRQRNDDEVSITALVAGQLDELHARLVELGLEVTNGLDGRGEIVTWGDWTLLHVAVAKILTNAAQHNRKGGRIEIEVVDRIREGPTLSCDSLQAQCGRTLPRADMCWRALRVANTGPVIPPDQLGWLFQRFELLHEIDHHHRGSGLSLSIVMAVLQRHEGAIGVRQVGAEGMAFYLILPMRESPHAREQNQALPVGIDNLVRAALTAAPSGSGRSQRVSLGELALAPLVAPAAPAPVREQVAAPR